MHQWENAEGFHATFWWRVVDGELCVFEKKGGRFLRFYPLDEHVEPWTDCESMARRLIDDNIELLTREAAGSRARTNLV